MESANSNPGDPPRYATNDHGPAPRDNVLLAVGRKWLGLIGGWMVHVVGSWKEDILFGTRGFLDLV